MNLETQKHTKRIEIRTGNTNSELGLPVIWKSKMDL